MSSLDKPLGGRIAIVGTGSRASMFVRGIVQRPNSQVVAICEPNVVRATYYNCLLQELGVPTVPVYKPEGFQEMLQKEHVETIVVTCIDALHDVYIVPALEAGGEFKLYELYHFTDLTCVNSKGPDGEAHDNGRREVQKNSGNRK